MIFTETRVSGAYVIELERRGDERGFFARLFDESEFAAHGLNPRIAQINLSYSPHRGTIRGLHHQLAPHREGKLARCVRGAIFDVTVDLRPDSETYMAWLGVELTAENRLSVYAPEGCAHGYQTLVDDTEILYPVSTAYAPEAERGVRFDDPAFGIAWPIPEPRVISPKDLAWPDYAPESSPFAGRGRAPNHPGG